jgi:ectoine hydroxylase-related dioxygenase (phytanoyl-CoA dioxygenase family)
MKHLFSDLALQLFLKNGYAKLEQAIPEYLLVKLHRYFEAVEADPDQQQKVVIENSNGSFVTNIDSLCNHENLACLELLAFPLIIEIAEKICGKDFFPVQEFAVIKNAGDENLVLWHQDMLHERKGNCFTMGIYLDDANENDGALNLIPQSHLSKKTICELANDPFIQLPAKKGDMLIHDMMLAHASGCMQFNKKRRVIYFEFISAAHVEKEHIYNGRMVQLRTKLLHTALQYHHILHPGKERYPVPDTAIKKLQSETAIRETIKEIYSEPVRAKPSAYCFENR